MRTHLLVLLLFVLVSLFSFVANDVSLHRGTLGEGPTTRAGQVRFPLWIRHLRPEAGSHGNIVTVSRRQRRATSEGRDNAEQAAPELSLENLSRGIWPEMTCILGLGIGIKDDSFSPFIHKNKFATIY